MSCTQQSLDAALDWYIELREAHAEDPRRQRWQAWLDACDANRQAWLRVQTLQQRLSGDDGKLLLSAWRATPHTTSRRAFVGKLCLLLGGAGGLAYTGQQLAWPTLGADLRTATGEQRRMALDNQLVLDINTDTALDIQARHHGTQLALLRGEIMVDSRQALPLQTQVRSGQTLIQAGQARFAVRALDDQPTRISVYQGQIGVVLADGEHSVTAGQQLLLSAGHFERIPLPLASDAWTRGLLISQSMPLGEFVQELDRYRPGFLHCASEIAQLRISGSFDLHRPDEVLATLGQVLPVRVRYRSRYWATLVPAA
ncbi:MULTISPECIES: FecR domain-containing protein [unclassified Pseudomonas]|uniref:FecR domain-containing protein n=1 Tax=unclassified Pseudomonas TaxID=196821 RepID=UPI002446E2B8|nr:MULTISPECIES: FecR domain-containing protein [unclassified Pseudomonas]MDH0300959.1 FecR domain-containing protein [Pseudomonas sp. GD04091]MDH1983509.1 FecR domain-containing protein [Pseudomonas sp. GD03689]